jgi:hypothetical protein
MRLLPTLRTVEQDEAEQAQALLEEVRQKRVEIARRNDNFTEIPAERLIPRGPAKFAWLVDAETDLVWVRSRGTTFVRDSVTLVSTHAPVTYFISGEGDIVPIEPAPSIPSWSWYIARQTRREIAAR